MKNSWSKFRFFKNSKNVIIEEVFIDDRIALFKMFHPPGIEKKQNLRLKKIYNSNGQLSFVYRFDKYGDLIMSQEFFRKNEADKKASEYKLILESYYKCKKEIDIKKINYVYEKLDFYKRLDYAEAK